MNAMIILLISIVVLAVGYVGYGGWLAKQWGVDAKRTTPAHELEDGVDYVPAKPYVVLGHHFSSIAGAGPINGPIQAAVFGWVPVLLWVLIGGIFFGAMHDFGALFASIRHKGQTLGHGDPGQHRRHGQEALLRLRLPYADPRGGRLRLHRGRHLCREPRDRPRQRATNLANRRTAMISVLFIVVAVVYGFLTRGRNIPAAAERRSRPSRSSWSSSPWATTSR